MQCSRASELMSLRLDGLLDDVTQIALDEHLASCVRCSGEWETFRALSRLLDSAPTATPAPDFVGRVAHRLAKRRARSKARRRRFVLLGASALLLLATLPAIVTLGGLLTDLSNPSSIEAGIRVVTMLLSAISSINSAVAHLFSAFLSTPGAVLVPAYVAIALMAVFLWGYTLLRIQTVSGKVGAGPLGYRVRVQNVQEVALS